jgi:protein SSD1
LTQQEIQEIIDMAADKENDEGGQSDSSDIVNDILSLYSIAQLLHPDRSNSAMFLKSPRLDINFQENTTIPVHIQTKKPLEASILLQEFQILANTQVAQKISSHFPDHALLRSQSLPNDRKLRGLTRYLDSLGYTIHPQSPSSLQKSIDAIENAEAKAVIETLVMKSMSQEKYFCTGAFDISRYHHYSLNTPLYTHFTCPTKRYADVVVHRQLEAYINSTPFFFMEPEIVQKTAQHCNVKTRAAENADEQTQHMFSSYYLANNSGVSTNRVQDAIVVGVQEGAFDVIVPDLGLERRIHTINLPLKSDTFSPSENVLHLVWIQGEPTVDAGEEERAALSEEDYEYSGTSEEEDVILVDIDTPGEEEEDVSEQVKILSIKEDIAVTTAQKNNRRRSTSIRAIQGEDAWVTQKECTFPNECRQLIRPFDFVKVVITADPIRSPPLIRVLAANPFVTAAITK